MEENQKSFIMWVKAHKKQLIITGVSVAAIIGIIIGLKNKEAIKELWNALEIRLSKKTDKMPESITIVQTAQPSLMELTSVRMYTPPHEPFAVRQHIRNLSDGRYHSAEKAAEAANLGITLSPNQTLVDMYTKCAA